MGNKVFTDNSLEVLSEKTPTTDSEAFVYLGQVQEDGTDVATDFGGGTILIAKRSTDDSNNMTVLKEITSLSNKDDRASRFILPPNQELVVALAGSSAANLYAEMQIGPRRNP